MPKICKKCNELKELNEFYPHSQMADGYLNMCKICSKRESTEYRLKNIDHYREIDRKRGNRQSSEYLKKWRKENSNKARAHSMVERAIKSKKLFEMPCEICGDNKRPHAHHDDYLMPLNIRWLCPIHHKEWHEINGEGLNGK